MKKIMIAVACFSGLAMLGYAMPAAASSSMVILKIDNALLPSPSKPPATVRALPALTVQTAYSAYCSTNPNSEKCYAELPSYTKVPVLHLAQVAAIYVPNPEKKDTSSAARSIYVGKVKGNVSAFIRDNQLLHGSASVAFPDQGPVCSIEGLTKGNGNILTYVVTGNSVGTATCVLTLS